MKIFFSFSFITIKKVSLEFLLKNSNPVSLNSLFLQLKILFAYVSTQNSCFVDIFFKISTVAYALEFATITEIKLKTFFELRDSESDMSFVNSKSSFRTIAIH